MTEKKGTTSRKVNIWAEEGSRQSFKENFVSALVATVATTLFTLILAWGKRHFIDKPLLKIMLHNESYIIEETVSDFGETDIHRYAYEAIQIINNDKQQGDRPILVSGDPSNPGYVTVAIRISNNGNLHANITDCELKLVKYDRLDDFEYAAHRIESTSNPDFNVVLYGNLPPAISTTYTVRARMQEDGSIIASTQPLVARIQPDSYKIYYARIKLSKYGRYRIKPVLHYRYRDKKDSASSEETIDIIYDDLENNKLEEKKALFDMTG